LPPSRCWAGSSAVIAGLLAVAWKIAQDRDGSGTGPEPPEWTPQPRTRALPSYVVWQPRGKRADQALAERLRGGLPIPECDVIAGHIMFAAIRLSVLSSVIGGLYGGAGGPLWTPRALRYWTVRSVYIPAA
jgi:hypothetical protein